jgi:protein gp37
MSDLFQDVVPTEYIANVVVVMSKVGWHTYQVLTKRAERMHELLTTELNQHNAEAHIWWGVSVEDRKYGLPRLDLLRRTPAVIRFLNIEPLLEDLGCIDLNGIHWVIVGGESGPGARKMEASWVERIRAQCEEQGVPFFFKQWGGVQKKRTGRLLHGRTYDALPDRQRSDVPPAEVRASIRAELDRMAALWTAKMARQAPDFPRDALTSR